jgi:hypothetical protein
MKFRFIGDPNHNGDGPGRIEKWGHSFNRVDWTEVEDETIIAKLKKHSHFEASKGGRPKRVPQTIDETLSALEAIDGEDTQSGL